jgi:hypothetical protein
MDVKDKLLPQLHPWYPLVQEGGCKSEPPGRFGEQNLFPYRATNSRFSTLQTRNLVMVSAKLFHL